MASVKVGDRVRIADREATAADAKSGLFYNYFRNLTGSIERVYDDGTVCVNVDTESLPEDVALRHREMEIAARDKWLNGLAQEQRNRLTEQDKQFNMSYKALVAGADVSPWQKGGSGKSAAKSSGSKAQKTSDNEQDAKPSGMAETPADAKAKAAGKAAGAEPASTASKVSEDQQDPKRLTQKDLAAREREFLESRKTK